MLYHLSVFNDFAPFLEGNWSPQTVANRGFIGFPPDIRGGKAAVQKKIIFERILGLTAQFAPFLLRNEVIKQSRNFAWIWQTICRHFNFVQSDVRFLHLANISRKPGEWYETFYQQIVANLEYNLLTATSNLHHDRALPTVDEVMSSTTGRYAVYLWFSLIDNHLPVYVARVYVHDLKTCTLKDIQPRLPQWLGSKSLLPEFSPLEEVQVHYTKSRFEHQERAKPNDKSKPSRGNAVCKSVSRPHIRHDVGDCWLLSKTEVTSYC